MNKHYFVFGLVAALFISIVANAQGTLDKSVTVDLTQGDFVRIVSMEPGNDKPLHVGETIDINSKIEYRLNEPKAALSLVIQKAQIDSKNLVDTVIASTTKAVSQGSGVIELTQSITVPDTDAIKVFTPLIVDGEKETQTVEFRVYEVQEK